MGMSNGSASGQVSSLCVHFVGVKALTNIVTPYTTLSAIPLNYAIT